MHTRIGTILILLSCLGTALAISGQDEDSVDSVVGAVEKADRKKAAEQGQSEPAAGEVQFDLKAIKRHIPKSTQSTALFDSKSWYTPPVVAASPIVNLSPPPPSAPPMPFTFVGRMIDHGEVTLFLIKSGRHYAVKSGDTVEESYRVDEIRASEAVITHLSTNTPQTLMFNSTAVGSSTMGSAPSPIVTPALTELRKPFELVPLEN